MASNKQKMGNVFQKIAELREIAKQTLPKMSLEELTNEVQFLANNWHGKKKSGTTK